MALRPLWRGYTAIDVATTAYVAIATGAVVLAFRGDGIPGWPWLILAHTLVLVLVGLAPKARTGTWALSRASLNPIFSSMYGWKAVSFTPLSTGPMMTMVMNRAREVRICVGGICGVPMACRRKWNTMMMRV